MSHKPPVITIDGAGGTGKGTVCHIIAKELGWCLLDSGALYRVLALAAEKHAISLDDEAKLQQIAETLDTQFVAADPSLPPQIILEGLDVTDDIRGERIGNMASKIGALSGVRAALLERQRAFRQPPGLATDGRDMGTVVFPDAILKVFLTASPEERGRRRFKQLKQLGKDVNLGDLVAELRERDKRDQERTVAPLKPAEDALIIDTDPLSVKEVVERIMLELARLQDRLIN